MVFAIFVLWALMALSFPIGKLALEFCSSPIQLIGLRMSLAGGIILGYLILTRVFSGQPIIQGRITLSDAWLFIKVSIFHVYLAFVCEFWALQFLDSIKVNLLFSLTPLISAALAFILIGQKLSAKKWIGLLCGFFGMILIMATRNLGEICWKNFFVFSLPELVLMIGIVSACYAWFQIKTLVSRNYSLLSINGAAFLMGGILCLTQYFFRAYPAIKLLPESGKFELFSLIGILILASNIIGYSLYGKLLSKYSNTFLSFTGFLCPIFGAIYSKLFSYFLPQYFSSEPLTMLYFIGFFMILSGLIIFYGQELMEKSSNFL